MQITLNLISSICWEILAKQTIDLKQEPLPVLKQLHDAVYDFSPGVAANSRFYWRRADKQFLEIADYLSFGAFLNARVSDAQAYLIILDCENSLPDPEGYLRALDLAEATRAEPSKYDCLKFGADEEIEECAESLSACSNFEGQPLNNERILIFALRNMPMGRCYTADICSGYSLIDCVRKGWPITKKILAPLPDEIIERKSKKDKEKQLGEPEKNKKTPSSGRSKKSK